MSEKAMIQDNTRCIGCRACMIACKEWNDLGADDSDFFAGDGYQNPRDLDENNYTLITYREEPAEAEWVFGRLLCMHCASILRACRPARRERSRSSPTGPVELTEWRCIGCRYCMQACPFVIPKFDYGSVFPKIHKCTFCSDRLAADLEPACAKVCPTHAIEFGDRDEMLSRGQAPDRGCARPLRASRLRREGGRRHERLPPVLGVLREAGLRDRIFPTSLSPTSPTSRCASYRASSSPCSASSA